MKRVVLSSPHWIKGVRHDPGSVVEMSDSDFEWYVGATQEARIAYQVLLEETVGTEQWARKEISKRIRKPADEPPRDEASE